MDDDDAELAADPTRRIVPGDPDPEHVAFVILGAVIAVLVLLRGIGLL